MTHTILPLLARFRGEFSQPSFENFQFLLLAWLMNPGRGWLSNCLKALLHLPDLAPTNTEGQPKHFSCLYRLFTRARWSKDTVGKILADGLGRWLPDQLTIIVDDTLFRRTGPMILGAGMHHDPLRTTYGKSGKKQFSFGLSFVMLAVWVPVPFAHAGGMAVPVLFRLYRSPKTCPEASYRTRPQLAAELLTIARQWWPTRPLEVTVDSEYVCKGVLQATDDNMVLTGVLKFNYMLYPPKPPAYSGVGRPAKWGEKMGSIGQLRDDKTIAWDQVEVIMYGQKVTLLTKLIQARWSSSGPDKVVTILITRDPTGTYDDACFLRTESNASVQSVLTFICLRWSLEVTFRDGKQHLHIEDIENGYVHREEPSATHRKTRPGPQAPPKKEPVASKRTVPLFMLGFGFVVLWYLEYGRPTLDLKWAKLMAPWWTHKTTISFGDMLQAFRRQMEYEDLWTNPPQQGFDEKYLRKLPFDWPGLKIFDEDHASISPRMAKL